MQRAAFAALRNYRGAVVVLAPDGSVLAAARPRRPPSRAASGAGELPASDAAGSVHDPVRSRERGQGPDAGRGVRDPGRGRGGASRSPAAAGPMLGGKPFYDSRTHGAARRPGGGARGLVQPRLRRARAARREGAARRDFAGFGFGDGADRPARARTDGEDLRATVDGERALADLAAGFKVARATTAGAAAIALAIATGGEYREPWLIRSKATIGRDGLCQVGRAAAAGGERRGRRGGAGGDGRGGDERGRDRAAGRHRGPDARRQDRDLGRGQGGLRRGLRRLRAGRVAALRLRFLPPGRRARGVGRGVRRQGAARGPPGARGRAQAGGDARLVRVAAAVVRWGRAASSDRRRSKEPPDGLRSARLLPLDELFSDEEKLVRDTVRAFVDERGPADHREARARRHLPDGAGAEDGRAGPARRRTSRATAAPASATSPTG